MAAKAKRVFREVAAMAAERQGDLGLRVCVPADDAAVLTDPWLAFLRGPEGTPYEGCVYAVQVKLTPAYPHAPPELMFLNRCWHPNIGVNGHVCLDVLGRMWAPSLTVVKILQSVQSLLDDPDPSSPLNGAAAVMFKEARASGIWAPYRDTIARSHLAGRPIGIEERHFPDGESVLQRL
jgi:ubiquitin-protein ligase